MTNLDFIYNRKSIREFKEGTIPKEDMLEMLKAATYAPSAKHQQHWHFVVVDGKEKIEEMAVAVTKSHTHIASLMKTEEEREAYMALLPYYINFQRSSSTVLVYSKEYDMIEETILRANGADEELINVLKSTHSAAQGIGAAVENFMLAATAMGYGTCYMTGPAHAKPEIEAIIGFEKPEYSLMSMIAVGIPADETRRQPKRKKLEDVVTFL